MSGAGNDFVLVDNRGAEVRESAKPALARGVCRRRLGVGADGLILIEPLGGLPRNELLGTTGGADFVMRYFNADGSEGELCGNGARCAAVFACEIGAGAARQTISTPAGVLRAEILSPGPAAAGTSTVEVEMPEPGAIRRLQLHGLSGEDGEVFALRVGVPHAVEVVPDLAAVDGEGRGAEIRRHPAFPAGTNANFITIEEDTGEIGLRTFERGVEAETLACGTGAIAAASVAHRFFHRPPVAAVRVRSGDVLHIGVGSGAPWMRGPVRRIYEGVYEVPSGLA